MQLKPCACPIGYNFMAYDAEYHRRYRERHQARIKERKRIEYLANQEKVKARSRRWSEEHRAQKLAIQQSYRQNNRGKRNQYMRERYDKTRPERISAVSLWRKANPEKYKAQYLKKEYGLTLQTFNNMIADQQSCCAICGVQTTDLGVDHDHESKRVRGLLCSGYNCGIGNFKDSPNFLRAAAEYLGKYPSVSEVA